MRASAVNEAFTVQKGGFKFEVKPSEGSGLDKFDIAYFTASCDTAKVNAEYVKQLKLDYAILSDPGKKTAEAYGVVTEKRKFPHRWTFFIGKDGKILHIEKKVDARGHGKQIVAKLKELNVDAK